MPEGPSIVILKEQAASFAGKKILSAEGDAKIDKVRLVGQRIVALRSWGKHFLIELEELEGFALRIHLLMFGTYRINERKDSPPRLSLRFEGGDELNFYTCSVKYIEGSPDDVYDWSADVMSGRWDAGHAGLRRAAGPNRICGCRQHHQERSAVSHSRASAVHRRCVACTQVAGTGGAGTAIQFRIHGVEEGVRFEKTLACTYQKHLPTLRYSANESASGKDQPSKLFLRAMPEKA
jgi:formamidopyrimidine-DNA glycosylase-like protein